MIKIYFRDDNPLFQRRIDYVLRFIEKHPLLQNQLVFTRDEKADFDLKLYYGMDQKDAFYIPSQKAIFSRVLPDFRQFVINKYQYKLMQLYAIEQKPKQAQTFLIDKLFQFDLIETIFFHISRIEEVYCKNSDLDAHERMDSAEQILVRYDLQQTPVVDHLVLAFARGLGLDLKSQPTRFRMTHDIDAIRKNNGFLGKMRTFAAAVLKLRDMDRAMRVLKDKSPNPYDTFDWLLLEDKNIEKVIYFLVEGTSRYDTPYDLRDPISEKAIRIAKERGYKIGVHPSYHTWKDKELMRREKQKLEDVLGTELQISRQHYLRFSFKNTPAILDDLEITEDATLGFGDRIGFRCGTGFPYYLYDFEQEKPYQFLEVPLVFMESALLEESGFQASKLEQTWHNFFDQNQENTMITCNVHNSRFYDAALSGIDLKALYVQRFI